MPGVVCEEGPESFGSSGCRLIAAGAQSARARRFGVGISASGNGGQSSIGNGVWSLPEDRLGGILGNGTAEL